jgi:anaerobic ribonucleoside-triphosphate reductase activating protein
MLKYYSYTIVFQEIPDETSLCFEITGCPLRCSGCHSPHLRNHKLGEELTDGVLVELLEKHKGFITCVLFFGGEWQEEDLINNLSLCRTHGLKTALYTGRESVSQKLKDHLDYLKTGPYIKELGGLQNTETTNQVLINVKTGRKVECSRPSQRPN